MRRTLLAAALLALASAACAAKPPDSLATTSAVYARRGSLGSNDYVATNVAPSKSAYQIVRVTDGRLRDRAVNVVSVTNDVTLSTPQRRLVAGYARSFCVALTVAADRDCRVNVEGPAKVWTSDSSAGFVVGRGLHLLQFLEVGDNEYAADVANLVETEGGN